MRTSLLLCLVLLASSAHAQFQNESKIVQPNRAAENYFGYSVDADKNVFIVGAPQSGRFEFAPPHNWGPGQVEFYAQTLTGVINLPYTLPSDLGTRDFFGTDVAISGDYAAVGAPQHQLDASGSNPIAAAGAVYIYAFNGSSWIISQKIVSPDRSQGDAFGAAISMSGDALVIASHGEDLDANGQNSMNAAGAVYVYRRNAQGQYILEQKIVASDRAAVDGFGYHVDISGHLILVGSPWHDNDAAGANFMNLAGAAYLYEFNGITWNEYSKLVPQDRATGDYFGIHVAVESTFGTLVVGSAFDEATSTGPQHTGTAYIFLYGSASVIESQKIVSGDPDGGEGFGQAIDVVPGIIAVGAFRDIDDLNGQAVIDSSGGAVFLYTPDATGMWSQSQKIISSDRFAGDHFGRTVALSSFDTLGISSQGLVVGAWKDDEDAQGGAFMERSGSIYLYGQSTIGLFEERAEATWTLFPNPSSEAVTISHLPVGQKEITVYDVEGRRVWTQRTSQDSLSLRLDGLARGIFTVEVRSGDHVSHRKLMVQ